MADTYRPLPKQALYIAMLFGVCSGNTLALDSSDAEKHGRHRYFQSCVICHGEDAKGTGMMANMLKVKSANLTTLSRNNGGKFPFERIYEKIDGRDMPQAHGMREMPVWGKIWEEETQCSSAETLVRGRILEIIIYLRSIQE